MEILAIPVELLILLGVIVSLVIAFPLVPVALIYVTTFVICVFSACVVTFIWGAMVLSTSAVSLWNWAKKKLTGFLKTNK